MKADSRGLPVKKGDIVYFTPGWSNRLKLGIIRSHTDKGFQIFTKDYVELMWAKEKLHKRLIKIPPSNLTIKELKKVHDLITQYNLNKSFINGWNKIRSSKTGKTEEDS